MMELKESPDGSIRTWEKTSSMPNSFSAKARLMTFTTLWMENRVSTSPHETTVPSVFCATRPNAYVSARANSGM